MSDATRAEVCIAACAEAFRGDGEIVANPIGVIPTIGARLAQASFEPDLVLADDDAVFITFRMMLEISWSGQRHVMMGASQIDRNGNQNIACIGSIDKPKVQLLGFRGAPGNTVNHMTSYFIGNHSPRTFVEKVDVVTGIGYTRASMVGVPAMYHGIRRVVSNLGVFDFKTPDRNMRLQSLHPGVQLDEVISATGFDLVIDGDIPETSCPSDEDLRLIRDVLDPNGLRDGE